MDYANRLEAIKEVIMDVEEGADMVMVKPGIVYLDVVREVKNAVNVPVSVYQVSGEYAMIKAAAQNGWLDHDAIMLEQIYAIKRAGADLIASYFAKDVVKLLSISFSFYLILKSSCKKLWGDFFIFPFIIVALQKK